VCTSMCHQGVEIDHARQCMRPEVVAGAQLPATLHGMNLDGQPPPISLVHHPEHRACATYGGRSCFPTSRPLRFFSHILWHAPLFTVPRSSGSPAIRWRRGLTTEGSSCPSRSPFLISAALPAFVACTSPISTGGGGSHHSFRFLFPEVLSLLFYLYSFAISSGPTTGSHSRSAIVAFPGFPGRPSSHFALTTPRPWASFLPLCSLKTRWRIAAPGSGAGCLVGRPSAARRFESSRRPLVLPLVLSIIAASPSASFAARRPLPDSAALPFHDPEPTVSPSTPLVRRRDRPLRPTRPSPLPTFDDEPAKSGVELRLSPSCSPLVWALSLSARCRVRVARPTSAEKSVLARSLLPPVSTSAYLSSFFLRLCTSTFFARELSCTGDVWPSSSPYCCSPLYHALSSA